MKTQSYKDLVVWQKGIALAKVVYRLTQNLPPEEKFGLVAQMRRSAISIPSNIAILSVELRFCDSSSAAPAFELKTNCAG